MQWRSPLVCSSLRSLVSAPCVGAHEQLRAALAHFADVSAATATAARALDWGIDWAGGPFWAHAAFAQNGHQSFWALNSGSNCAQTRNIEFPPGSQNECTPGVHSDSDLKNFES